MDVEDSWFCLLCVKFFHAAEALLFLCVFILWFFFVLIVFDPFVKHKPLSLFVGKNGSFLSFSFGNALRLEIINVRSLSSFSSQDLSENE